MARAKDKRRADRAAQVAAAGKWREAGEAAIRYEAAGGRVLATLRRVQARVVVEVPDGPVTVAWHGDKAGALAFLGACEPSARASLPDAGLDLVARVFAVPGSFVAVERPRPWVSR